MTHINYEIPVIFLIVFISLCFIFSPASAAQTANSSLNISTITENSITWEYTYLTANRPEGATLDGVTIEGWKIDLVYNYTASELAPNTTHEFCIYGSATSNCLKGTTLTSTLDNSLTIILSYIFFIIAIICILLTVIGVPYIAWAGAGFAIIGIVQMQGISFWGGFIFMVVCCSAIIVAFTDISE